MKRSYFFFLLITCLCIWQYDKKKEWELMECESRPRRIGTITFSFFSFIKRRMFAVCIILFFLIIPYPDFSFVYIIDIVTHTHTLLFLVLLIVLCNCLTLPYIYMIDEICSLFFLQLIICSNIHFEQEEKKELRA